MSVLQSIDHSESVYFWLNHMKKQLYNTVRVKVTNLMTKCILPLSPWKLHFTINLPLFLFR